jgi:Co/Zn/Cd efflux system component
VNHAVSFGATGFFNSLLVLARYRHHRGSLTKAAFLSARNDVLANVAVILVGFITAYVQSIWPDLIIGLGIAAINAGATREVWRIANDERLAADSAEA